MRDPIREALHLIDFPAEDIRDWLGEPCGCPERQQKRDMLRQYAKRILDGTLPNPYECLERLLQT